jgi:hypothetical protein
METVFTHVESYEIRIIQIIRHGHFGDKPGGHLETYRETHTLPHLHGVTPLQTLFHNCRSFQFSYLSTSALLTSHPQVDQKWLESLYKHQVLIPNDSNASHLFPVIVYLYVALAVAARRPARSFQIALVLQPCHGAAR